ncbi:MAG: pilus assembly protein PilM [Candidatus Omnitrophica bacterium]|nr:pilus assembly protein PilM [Candidatus Omnitrophota bacterium]
MIRVDQNRDVIGIDFSGEELTLSYWKKTGRQTEFVNLLHYPIQGLSEDDIAAMIAKIIKDLKIKNPYIVAVIPLHLAITKNLEIPSLDAQEIREIIDLQSGRQTPYSREEIIVDYINIGTYRQSYTKILLVIVTRSAIKRQVTIIEKAGFRIEKLCFAPEGISQVCQGQAGKEAAQATIGIIHVDANFTDFIVALRGIPIFTRTIPIGVKHLSVDEAKFKLKFAEELKNSLETYQSEDIDVPPSTLMLTGATGPESVLESVIVPEVRISLRRFAYIDFLPLHHDVAAIPALTQQLSFFNVTALFVAPRPMTVDLVPEEIKLKRLFEARTRELMKMSVSIICIVLLVGVAFLGKMYSKGLYLETLKKQDNTYSGESQVLEKAMERIRLIKHYLKTRGHALQVISALYDTVPKSIMLSDIKVDAERNVSLKGTAQAMSNVFSFVSALEKSNYFGNVKTNYTTSRKQDAQDVADFGISCVIKDR